MHHANLLVGDSAWAYAHAQLEIDSENPDMAVYEYDRMAIADARSLIQNALLRPVRESYRTFVIVAQSILPEAQNALLKLFEEPNSHTIFYLIIPREDILLPTLRSRMHLLGTEVKKSDEGEFSTFLQLSYIDRLAIIAEKLKSEDDEWTKNIVNGYEEYAQKSRNSERMKDALLLSTYIPTVGSSKKMLLEHIALSL